MDQERPRSVTNSAVFVERRSGPADRRQSQRGGRRATDIVAVGLTLSTVLVTACSTQRESFSPLAPTSVESGLHTEPAVSPPQAPSDAEQPQPDATGRSEPEANEPSGEPDADNTGTGGTGGDPNGADESGTDGSSTVVTVAPLGLEPQTVTLEFGKTLQFTAKGAKGTVTWQATGGTITKAGLYTAGTSAGTFTVTASTVRQGKKTAQVTIKQPAAPTGGTGDGGTGGGTSGGGGTTGDGGTGGTTSGTIITVGQSIQAAVNAHPEGTTFTIKAGVHKRQSIKPKSGMTFIGEPGAVLDGENATAHAFAAYGAKNVTVRGLRITNYTPPNLSAAIDGVDSTGWVVENNEIDHNANGSLRVYGVFVGSNWTVRNNKIHHNAWQGITGWNCTDTIIDSNEVYMNPPAPFTDTIGDTGNMKFYGCGRITVRNNYVHDSPRFGIWFDRSQPDITIENNRVINHGQAGIWYEVSYRGVIRANYVENAGTSSYYSSGWLRGGGIQVTNSPDVSVLNNTVVNSLNGIIGLQASGYYHGNYGNSELRNFLVQGNKVTMAKGQTGIASNDGNSVYDSWNNRFVGNSYTTSTSTPFQWKGSNLTVAEWKAGPGKADLF